ncbi:hypothetical protein V8C37DRAFT_340027 [Trichoderma ceciliae]
MPRILFLYLPSRTAYIHPPELHSHRFSWSNLSTIREAVAHVLLSKNFPIVANQYVHVFQCYARGLEHAEWELINVDLEEKLLEEQNKLAHGDTSSLGYILCKAIYNTGGNYDSEGVVMNEKQGMKVEKSLDETIERVIIKLFS